MWQEFEKRVALQWYRTGMETLCELLQLLEYVRLSEAKVFWEGLTFLLCQLMFILNLKHISPFPSLVPPLSLPACLLTCHLSHMELRAVASL